MERATQRDELGYYLVGDAIYGDCGVPEKFRGDDVDRLAAYENTGVEPEDFKKAFNEDAQLKLTGQLLGITPDRLRELVQADREGRCVVLPCKVGEKMYDIILGELREKRVIFMSMLLSKFVNHLVVHAANFRNAVTSYELQDIGKTVFLTREDAEAALRREQE